VFPNVASNVFGLSNVAPIKIFDCTNSHISHNNIFDFFFAYIWFPKYALFWKPKICLSYFDFVRIFRYGNKMK